MIATQNIGPLKPGDTVRVANFFKPGMAGGGVQGKVTAVVSITKAQADIINGATLTGEACVTGSKFVLMVLEPTGQPGKGQASNKSPTVKRSAPIQPGDEPGTYVVNGKTYKTFEEAAREAGVQPRVVHDITTPNKRLQKWALNEGQFVNPETNALEKTTEHLYPDHVYPDKLIEKLPGFDRLTRKQQSWLRNYPGNFEPLTLKWNSSKRDRLAERWAKTPLGRTAHPDYIKRLKERQDAFKEFAKAMIAYFLDE